MVASHGFSCVLLFFISFHFFHSISMRSGGTSLLRGKGVAGIHFLSVIKHGMGYAVQLYFLRRFDWGVRDGR